MDLNLGYYMFKAITDKKTRREEFVFTSNAEEYNVIFGELKGDYERPHVIGKEGNIYSLYYNVKQPMFKKKAELYALKVNNKTGDVTRKAYYKGNTSGLKVKYDVIATGEFLDDANTYTLYHGEDVSFEEAISMAKSYTGTTYKEGKAARVTLYETD